MAIQIQKLYEQVNANNRQIAESKFDSASLRTVLVHGKRSDSVEFILNKKVVATLGPTGLAFSVLADEDFRSVWELVGGQEITIPSKGGSIKSIEKDFHYLLPTLYLSTKESAKEFARKIEAGVQFYQVIISNWRAADFIRA